jgi:tRNA dimethylallyltransferase
MTERPAIVVIAGPTASGKSAAAVGIAERFGGEIVGADSVHVYRGFDIGSAKPEPSARARVPHHVIDVLAPDEPIDAAGYARLADAAISDVAARGHVPIIVGGTGLWIRALVRGLVSVPPPEPTIRASLEREADAVGAPALHRRLVAVDPDASAVIHPNDRFRIVRALEVHAQTGYPLGALRKAHALGAPRYPTLSIVLDVPKPVLAASIDRRVDAMLEAGWIDEARALRERFGDHVRAFGSVGYRQILAHLRSETTYDETVARIRRATKVYARRQRTWWNGEPGVDLRLSPESLASDDVVTRIALHLDR